MDEAERLVLEAWSKVSACREMLQGTLDLPERQALSHMHARAHAAWMLAVKHLMDVTVERTRRSKKR